MNISLKQIGRWGLLILGAAALWSMGPVWKGAVQTEQAFAQTQINNATPFNFTLQTYYDVSSSAQVSAGGYGGPGHSGGSGDNLLRLINRGNFQGNRLGSICGVIFVLDDDQELQECCLCPLSADKVLTLSTISDLTSNPLFKNAKMSLGTIKVISCIGTTTVCSGDCIVEKGLLAWISHAETIASNLPPSFGFTTSTSVDEVPSVPIDFGEIEHLVQDCNFAQTQGSGAGICDCGASAEAASAPQSQSSSPGPVELKLKFPARP